MFISKYFSAGKHIVAIPIGHRRLHQQASSPLFADYEIIAHSAMHRIACDNVKQNVKELKHVLYSTPFFAGTQRLRDTLQ